MARRKVVRLRGYDRLTMGTRAQKRRGALTDDLRHMTATWGAPAARVWLAAIPRIVALPRFRAVVLFRLSQWSWCHHLRPLAYWLEGRGVRTAGAELHPAACIGPGLNISHSVGIVVGHETTAGRDLVLYQGATLGHTGRGGTLGQPRLGDRVRVGAGARVLGDVTIGDDAWIGANSVVLADVPAGAVVRGVWGRTAAGKEPDQPPAGAVEDPVRSPAAAATTGRPGRPDGAS